MSERMGSNQHVVGADGCSGFFQMISESGVLTISWLLHGHYFHGGKDGFQLRSETLRSTFFNAESQFRGNNDAGTDNLFPIL